MALEGTLEDFSLADIFQLIGIQRKTGILTLKSSEETVTVTFHNGMVIGADTSPRKLEDRIGKVLVKTGLITQAHLDEALEHQKRTLQKIGFILIDQRYLSKEQLKEALQIQVTQMIYRLFRWNSGEYYFDQKTRVDPNSDESIPPMSAESILMEGIHMIDEWPVIQKRIPTFSIIFRPNVAPEDIETGQLQDDDNGLESYKVRLSREEDSVFRMVDGKNTVADIIESSKLGEFHTCRALYDMLERKIIEPAGTSSMPRKVPTLVVQTEKSSFDFLKLGYPLVAVGIVGLLLLSLRDPLRLTGFDFFRKQDTSELRESLDRGKLQLLDAAIMMYFYVNGSLPSRLEELAEGRYVRSNDLVDPLSRPYVYEVDGDSYSLTAHSRDGSTGKAAEIHRTVIRNEIRVNQSRSAGPALRIETSE